MCYKVNLQVLAANHTPVDGPTCKAKWVAKSVLSGYDFKKGMEMGGCGGEEQIWALGDEWG